LTNENGLTLGQYLRQERERKNISLEAVSKVTRITLKNLEALEKDDFLHLPAAVFVRGFLRAYASYLGLDPQQLMTLYDTQTGSAAMAAEMVFIPPPKKWASWLKLAVIPALVVFGLILILFNFGQKPSAPPPSPPSPPVEVSSPQPPPPKVPASKNLVAVEEEKAPLPSPLPKEKTLVAKEKKPERRHVLKVKAIETTWLRIQSDGQQEVDALLQPKETATWTARRQFKITVGNAGGVNISFNGVPQGRLGDSGEVVHLLLPKEIKKRTAVEKKKESKEDRSQNTEKE